MTPFETLLKELGDLMGTPLAPDHNQACYLEYTELGLSVQIDLDGNADQILVGTQLGTVPPGAYRDRIFTQALRVNAMSLHPRGILAFSEKNDTLVLFQFLSIAILDGTKLFQFLQLFLEHAKVWTDALTHQDIPPIEEDASAEGSSGMFGLTQ